MTMQITNKDIIDTFEFRYACKKFDENKAISDENFTTILQAGRLSPSSFGFEPWKFLIIQNADIRKKLSPVAWGAQNALSGASHFVIFLARKKIDTLYSADYITHMMTDVQKLPQEVAQGKRGALEGFEKNDFNLLESDRAIFDWASKQTYIALGNMLTSAALLGIDSCPIEGFNRASVEDILEKEGILDTTHFGVSVMAGFGYRAQQAPAKTRQPLTEVVTWVK